MEKSCCWMLLTLYMKGVLAGDWSVHLPSGPICAVIGSSVELPCSYDYPQSSNETRRVSAQDVEESQEYKVLSEMWCLEDRRCVTPRYVFHSDRIFQDPSYQNRVQYLGRAGTKNCSLRISDLRPSDSGSYVFYLVTNHPTEKMPEQNGVQLLVADSPDAVVVSASPSSGPVEGSSVRLSCCSPAVDPQTSFRWFRSPGNSQSHRGQTWSISRVTSDQSGSFYCQIQTGDKVQNSKLLTVDVQYAPRSTSVSVSPPGEQQDDLPVNLTCSSDSNPPVNRFLWYREAACLPAADRSFHEGRRTTTTSAGKGLSSSSITVEDYGMHCCVATNRHGSQTCSVTLRPSTSLNPTEASGSRMILIGVSVGVLLVIIAIIAFLMTRKRKSSRNRSYVLTETRPAEP